jgi:hypothetical protein
MIKTVHRQIPCNDLHSDELSTLLQERSWSVRTITTHCLPEDNKKNATPPPPPRLRDEVQIKRDYDSSYQTWQVLVAHQTADFDVAYRSDS